MDVFWDYFSVLAPSVGVGLVFWLVMRSIFRADQGERSARARIEEQEALEWGRLKDEEQRHSDGANSSPR